MVIPNMGKHKIHKDFKNYLQNHSNSDKPFKYFQPLNFRQKSVFKINNLNILFVRFL